MVRNKQLAAVREIAIGVDTVRTIDEALSLAVERARDIEGIRFVFVQKVDVTGEFIITPYYSKIRNTYAARAIKAQGFDAEKELGDSPESKNLLRFPNMKLKIAKDYLRNPRVMDIPTLAELHLLRYRLPTAEKYTPGASTVMARLLLSSCQPESLMGRNHNPTRCQ